jgi:LCP family protein required for cell wall assembly
VQPDPRLPGGGSSPPGNGRRDVRRRRRRDTGVTPRALALVAAGVLISAAAGAGAYFLPLLLTGVSTSVASGSLPNPVLDPAAAPTQPFTVLLLGSDDDSKFTSDRILTQSMILVRVVPATKQVTMLSIPRDLWVPVAGHGMAKIDTAYAAGGSSSAIAAVQDNFKVKIDDYVWVGLKGLVSLIDRVGGVDVNVTNPVVDDFYPADIYGGNPYSYSRVAVLPGYQHLDGVHALEYVRSRHGDLRGDFGRSARQQQVLLALKAQAKNLNVADLPDLATAFQGELKTSMGLDRVRAMLPLTNQIGGPNIKQVVLLAPYTSPAVIDGQDVIVPNWAEILPLVRQAFS